jgi:hypothetical protein
VTAVAVLVLEGPALGRVEWVTVGALAAYAGWAALSILWSPSAAQPVLEVERTVLYLGSVLAVLLLSSNRSPELIVGGVLAAITGIAAGH